MAQDITTKEENLVDNTMYNYRKLLEALDALKQNALELQVCTIANADTFSRPTIQHITGYEVNAGLGQVLDAFLAVRNDSFNNSILEKIK